MVQLMQETFPRNIEIVHSVPKDLWTVQANPTQVHQVLMNLCVNARDAMPDGGKLIISAKNVTLTEADANVDPQAKPGRYVLLAVRDTGHGIPPEILQRIFEPFFTTKPPGRGTGLGLPTVLGIVKNHGGFATVDSAPGRGSTFKVYLPAAESPKIRKREKAVVPMPRGKGELILLVDDEPSIREAATSLFERHGYRVLTASNGEEGTRVFVEHRTAIQLVLTDIMMPVMSGIEFVRSLRLLEPDMSVIALTGSEDEEKRLGGLNLTAVLKKPCDPELLLATIHSALSRPAKHDK
jgi:CheY-like chemotaxis protein